MSHALTRVALLVGALVPAVALGQHASEFTVRDKSEIFIQHIVKFMKIDPADYRSIVLEYELGQALAEATQDHEHTDGCIHEQVGLGGDFIENALVEIHPGYAEAKSALDAGETERAAAAFSKLSGDIDPYVSAHARLRKAELDFTAGQYDDVLRACEKIVLDDRVRLLDDYKACALVAQCFEKQEKPLLEFAQWMILLVDYEEVPPRAKADAETRVAALEAEVGRPLHTVAGWMNTVEKALASESTGEPTQEQEGEILTALDKLIELTEAQERNTCSSCGGGSCSGGKCSGDPKGNRSKNPARVSKLPPRGEGSTALSSSRGDVGSIWGQLRMKDASKALQSFSGKLPAHYEQLLEQYYKDLAREE